MERLESEMRHHDRVLAPRKKEHWFLKLGGRLAKNKNRLRFELGDVVEFVGLHGWDGRQHYRVKNSCKGSI